MSFFFAQKLMTKAKIMIFSKTRLHKTCSHIMICTCGSAELLKKNQNGILAA